METEYALKRIKTVRDRFGGKTTHYEYGRLKVEVYAGPSAMGNDTANFSVFDGTFEVNTEVSIDEKNAREDAEYTCREYLKDPSAYRDDEDR